MGRSQILYNRARLRAARRKAPGGVQEQQQPQCSPNNASTMSSEHSSASAATPNDKSEAILSAVNSQLLEEHNATSLAISRQASEKREQDGCSILRNDEDEWRIRAKAKALRTLPLHEQWRLPQHLVATIFGDIEDQRNNHDDDDENKLDSKPSADLSLSSLSTATARAIPRSPHVSPRPYGKRPPLPPRHQPPAPTRSHEKDDISVESDPILSRRYSFEQEDHADRCRHRSTVSLEGGRFGPVKNSHVESSAHTVAATINFSERATVEGGTTVTSLSDLHAVAETQLMKQAKDQESSEHQAEEEARPDGLDASAILVSHGVDGKTVAEVSALSAPDSVAEVVHDEESKISSSEENGNPSSPPFPVPDTSESVSPTTTNIKNSIQNFTTLKEKLQSKREDNVAVTDAVTMHEPDSKGSVATSQASESDSRGPRSSTETDTSTVLLNPLTEEATELLNALTAESHPRIPSKLLDALGSPTEACVLDDIKQVGTEGTILSSMDSNASSAAVLALIPTLTSPPASPKTKNALASPRASRSRATSNANSGAPQSPSPRSSFVPPGGHTISSLLKVSAVDEAQLSPQGRVSSRYNQAERQQSFKASLSPAASRRLGTTPRSPMSHGKSAVMSPLPRFSPQTRRNSFSSAGTAESPPFLASRTRSVPGGGHTVSSLLKAKVNFDRTRTPSPTARKNTLRIPSLSSPGRSARSPSPAASPTPSAGRSPSPKPEFFSNRTMRSGSPTTTLLSSRRAPQSPILHAPKAIAATANTTQRSYGTTPRMAGDIKEKRGKTKGLTVDTASPSGNPPNIGRATKSNAPTFFDDEDMDRWLDAALKTQSSEGTDAGEQEELGEWLDSVI